MTRPLAEITAAEPLSRRPAIRVDDLHKTFGELVAIDGVSFEIAQGEFFMIVGPRMRQDHAAARSCRPRHRHVRHH